MTFQFLCPQGHLLQGDEAHMGMQCQCPQCGTAFIIPTVGGAGGAAAAPTQPEPQVELGPLQTDDELSQLAAQPSVGRLQTSELGVSEFNSPHDENILHIPCPNGHELETPLDFLGHRAMCPHCGVEFRLRREKSVEYQREQEIIERQRAQFWIRAAIIAAAVVGLVLVVMIVISAVT